MMIWVLIGVLAIGNVLLKTAGPVLAGGKQPSAPVSQIITLLAPALIAALVVSGTFTYQQTLVVDARVGGLAIGAVALLLRAPLWVALLLSVVTCALLRTVG